MTDGVALNSMAHPSGSWWRSMWLRLRGIRRESLKDIEFDDAWPRGFGLAIPKREGAVYCLHCGGEPRKIGLNGARQYWYCPTCDWVTLIRRKRTPKIVEGVSA